MPDLINNQKRLQGNEKIDLRHGTESADLSDPQKLERPALPEQFESEPNDSRFGDSISKKGTTEQQGQIIAGGIISAGQNRAAEEQRYHDIENILSDGMESLYLAMDARTQLIFKNTGETASMAINDLISKGKCNLKKVLEIIKNWLIIIPGVNKFFIEQEAKIKADKIMNIQRKYG